MKKTILVVGAGKGLGAAVAGTFAENGFRVVLMARGEEHLKALEADFAAKGIEVYMQTADASDFDGFARAYQQVVAAWGVPDVLFYNVGIVTPDPWTGRISARTLMERYAADTAGAYNLIQLADTPEFAEKKGAILITGGGLAFHPHAAFLPLSMDKAALRAMVQALAPVLEKKGIFLGIVQVSGIIGREERYAPKAIAEEFWKLYTGQESHEVSMPC